LLAGGTEGDAMKLLEKFQLRWFDAILIGFLVALTTIWSLKGGPEAKYELTSMAFFAAAAFGAVCGLVAYLWKRSRQPKP
jgi:hypothetical protein